jgi:membrane protease YdiL (CAAX protease family)
LPADRLTSSDKRALLLWVAAGILGSLFAYKFFFRAFPEASVNFQVSREEALQRAQKFVGGLGENIGGYQSTIIFDVDDNAKTYLERAVGPQQANQLMSSELNIWYWDVRFFRVQQEEEFRVRINPQGQIVGYAHIIPKSMAGSSLDRAAAQAIAQDFLTRRLGTNLDGWNFLPEEVNSEKMPARVDWTFNWEKKDFRAKDAPYRLKAVVHGDQPGGTGEYLQVPEAWERSYKQLRSKNDFLTEVALVPYLIVLGMALWLGIALTRRGQARWGGAIKLGLVVAALLFCMQINDWPVTRAGYDTNVSYGSFVFQQIAIAVLFGLGTAATITLVMPAGEALYKVSQPGRLRLGTLLSIRALRSKEFFSAAVVGLSLTGLSLGYVVAFYLAGSHFGVWAPQELNYTNSVSTIFPWISGVAIGLLAATNEEFTFRLFAIPFFQRLTGSRWLAVILPAFFWSFLHANYPQEPPYIRGIEIGIMGIIAGVVMLRWGIMATLIWHYTFDAAQVGLLLIRSNSLYFKISGIVVGAAVVAPLAFACISYLSRGAFETDEDLLNGAEPAPDLSLASAPAADQASPAVRRYEPLTSAMIGLLGICIVFGALAAWKLKTPLVGDYLKLSANSREVRASADQVMHARGLDPRSYRSAAIFVDTTDAAANEFLRERIGIAKLNDIYATLVPGALWRVRYFRDSQPEEFAVILNPDGSIYSLRHALAEEAPGASLSKEEAIARAQKFLSEEKKIGLKEWTLVESNSDKKPHRVDHTLTWQRNDPLDAGPSSASGGADHAYARLDVQVFGDEVTNFRKYVKIPDDWRREQKKITLFRTVFSYGIPYLFLGGFAGAILIVFLMNLKSDAARSIPWKRIAFWSAWGLCGYLLTVLFGNFLAVLLNGYETSMPLKIFAGTAAIGLLLSAPFLVGGIALLFGMAWYYGARAFGEERLPGWVGMPGAYYRDAFWIGAGGTSALVGIHHVVTAALAHWPAVHRTVDSSIGQSFPAFIPAAALLGGSVMRGLFVTALVLLIAAFVAAQVTQVWQKLMVFLLGVLGLSGSDWGNSADLAQHLLAAALFLGIYIFGVRRIIRFNLLGCFLIAMLTALLGGALELLKQPNDFYRANGFGLVLCVLVLLAWPLVAWRMQPERT